MNCEQIRREGGARSKHGNENGLESSGRYRI